MTRRSSLIRRFSQLDRPSPQVSDQLSTVPMQETLRDHGSNFPAQDPLGLVDSFDDVRVSFLNSLGPCF